MVQSVKCPECTKYFLTEESYDGHRHQHDVTMPSWDDIQPDQTTLEAYL